MKLKLSSLSQLLPFANLESGGKRSGEFPFLVEDMKAFGVTLFGNKSGFCPSVLQQDVGLTGVDVRIEGDL